MKEIKDLVIVDSYEELKNLSKVIWEESEVIRKEKLAIRNTHGVFYLEDEETWPKYFKYHEPWDYHFCGNYTEITAKEAFNYLKDIKDELSKTIAYIDNIIENLK